MRLIYNDRILEATIGNEIKREQLHGRTQRFMLHNGEPLKKAFLRPTGELIMAGEITRQEIDPKGSLLETAKRYTDSGAEAELPKPSEETGLVLTKGDISDLALYAVESIRPVETLLEEGVYHTTYAGNRSVHQKDAVLLVKKDGAFLLIGDRRQALLLGQAANYDFFTKECETEGPESDEDLLSSFAA